MDILLSVHCRILANNATSHYTRHLKKLIFDTILVITKLNFRIIFCVNLMLGCTYRLIIINHVLDIMKRFA